MYGFHVSRSYEALLEGKVSSAFPESGTFRAEPLRLESRLKETGVFDHVNV